MAARKIVGLQRGPESGSKVERVSFYRAAFVKRVIFVENESPIKRYMLCVRQPISTEQPFNTLATCSSRESTGSTHQSSVIGDQLASYHYVWDRETLLQSSVRFQPRHSISTGFSQCGQKTGFYRADYQHTHYGSSQRPLVIYPCWLYSHA
ncbi:hypothetical protein BT63DRAFT_456546 [Microthyrium microscopicum]|uniref:Uncharacterized protein n=1 Tax=Microthyrium microscopicum TaxID=703497 RepID=A0A6A6U6H2_9PEZI|nr:hypothetical protein BT63DRAFT_456546 [Microthyrium microscopicum]